MNKIPHIKQTHASITKLTLFAPNPSNIYEKILEG